LGVKTRVILRTYSYRQDAEAARSLLDAAGIDSFVAADDCGAQYPGKGFVQGVRLLVDSDQSDRANSLLGPAIRVARTTASIKNPPKRTSKKRK
jgi:hypothetical protein